MERTNKQLLRILLLFILLFLIPPPEDAFAPPFRPPHKFSRPSWQHSIKSPGLRYGLLESEEYLNAVIGKGGTEKYKQIIESYAHSGDPEKYKDIINLYKQNGDNVNFLQVHNGYPKGSELNEAIRNARPFTQELTEDPKQAKVYIKRTDNGYFVVSNLKTQTGGKEYNRVGEILYISSSTNKNNLRADYLNELSVRTGTDYLDGNSAFARIIQPKNPTDNLNSDIKKIFNDHVHIEAILDTSMFDNKGFPLISLPNVKNLKIADGKSGKIVFTKRVETLKRTEPPPLIKSKIKGCCLSGIPPYLAPRFLAQLKAQPLKKEDIHFISFIKDSATQSAISKATRIKNHQLLISKIDDIETSFQRVQGKTIIFVGHIEKGNFVMRDAKGDILLTAPQAYIRSIAKQYDVRLLDLGCETAQQIQKTALGLGVETRFNTVDAVRSIDHALLRSKNYAEFLESLSAKGLQIIIDKDFVNGAQLNATIYSKLKDISADIWVKIAHLVITFTDKDLLSEVNNGK